MFSLDRFLSKCDILGAGGATGIEGALFSAFEFLGADCVGGAAAGIEGPMVSVCEILGAGGAGGILDLLFSTFFICVACSTFGLANLECSGITERDVEPAF